MRSPRTIALAATALIGTLGCEAPTVMRLVITSQLQVPSEVAAIDLTIQPEGVDLTGIPDPEPGAPPFRLVDHRVPFAGPGARAFRDELWVDVVPYAPLGPEHDVRIIVAPDVGGGCPNPGMAGSVGAYAPVSLLRRFTPHGLRVVHVELTRDCCGVVCADGLYCARGVCVPEDGSCNDPPSVTIPCGQGLCTTQQPRCLLGEVNDCVDQGGSPDLAQCGTGVDADCDGRPDTGPETVQYRDLDADGFGDPNGELLACGLQPGHVERSGDCADRDPARRPGVAEVCNALDDDCDGAVDEGLGGPRTFGTGACACRVAAACLNGVVQTCTQGMAGAETCNGVDDDCDGNIDNDVTCSEQIRFGDLVDVFPLERTEGDSEFNGHGPEVTVRVEYRGRGSFVDAEVCVHMRETTSDWTTGEACRTVSRPASGTVLRVSPSSGVFRYTDTDHAEDPIDPVPGIAGGRCLGDRQGGDICGAITLPTVPPVRACSWCEVLLPDTVTAFYR